MSFIKKIPGFRSGSKWKQFVAILGYGFILLVIYAALSGDPEGSSPHASQEAIAQNQNTSSDLAQNTTPQVSSEQTKAEPQQPQEPTWTEVASWSGSGIKNTETFQVSSREWRINWETSNENIAGIFQVLVYDANGSNQMPVSIPVNAQGVGSDTTYIREGPGAFYLEINSANVDWKITVEDQR